MALQTHAVRKKDPEGHKGALEGDRPEDEQHGNPNAIRVNEDENGLPTDEQAVAEDVLGANEDKSQG